MKTELTSILLPASEIALIRHDAMDQISYWGKATIDHGDLVVFEDCDCPGSTDSKDYVYAIVGDVEVITRVGFTGKVTASLRINFEPVLTLDHISVN
jgi:hypothetical protein